MSSIAAGSLMSPLLTFDRYLPFLRKFSEDKYNPPCLLSAKIIGDSKTRLTKVMTVIYLELTL